MNSSYGQTPRVQTGMAGISPSGQLLQIVAKTGRPDVRARVESAEGKPLHTSLEYSIAAQCLMDALNMNRSGLGQHQFSASEYLALLDIMASEANLYARTHLADNEEHMPRIREYAQQMISAFYGTAFELGSELKIILERDNPSIFDVAEAIYTRTR